MGPGIIFCGLPESRVTLHSEDMGNIFFVCGLHQGFAYVGLTRGKVAKQRIDSYASVLGKMPDVDVSLGGDTHLLLDFGWLRQRKPDFAGQFLSDNKRGSVFLGQPFVFNVETCIHQALPELLLSEDID